MHNYGFGFGGIRFSTAFWLVMDDGISKHGLAA